MQILRSLVEQRLTAATEDIFGLLERTMAEYKQELCRTKEEENPRQRQILDSVRNPRGLTHKTGLNTFVSGLAKDFNENKITYMPFSYLTLRYPI